MYTYIHVHAKFKMMSQQIIFNYRNLLTTQNEPSADYIILCNHPELNYVGSLDYQQTH